MSKDSEAKLISLAILFLLLINFPILAIFDQEYLLFGAPILFVYLFAVWAIAILLTALIHIKSKP